MNRHKFTVHLALAAALVLLAAIVGQVRRWDWRSEFTPRPGPQQVLMPVAPDFFRSRLPFYISNG